MKKVKSRILGIAVLLTFLIGASSSTMANENELSTTVSDTINIRKGFEAIKCKKVVGYELIKFGFLGGEFSRIVNKYDFVSCCKPTGDPMDGCSAKEMCAKYK